MMIVAKAHIKLIAKAQGLLSNLTKQEIEWVLSSGDNPAFQVFCTQAIELFDITSEFADMISPEYYSPFFHVLCYVLKNTPDKGCEIESNTSSSSLKQCLKQ